jgi:hypothetical protein
MQGTKSIIHAICACARQPKRRFLAAILCGFILAPADAFAQTCGDQTKPMARLELIFGGNSPKGPIGPRSFSAFLGKEVTPRFPDGLSLVTGFGQWRGPQGKITKETSRILLILYQPGPTSEAKIEAIRSAYKIRFKQQSVMRIDGLSCVSF